MKFSDLTFFIAEAFIGMRRSGLMIFIAVATITVSLIIFGVFLLLSLNLNNLVNFIVAKLEVRVYLAENVTRPEISAFQEQIQALKEVKSVEFVEKNTAWKDFSNQFSNINLNDMIEENPLPNTLKIQLYDTTKIKDVVDFLYKYPTYIDDISYGGVLAERIGTFAKFMKYMGLILVLLLTFATLLIVVNTIRLTVIARKEEISIMQLVGATNIFIEIPFLIEGLFLGILGSGFAIFFLKTAYVFFAQKFQEAVPYFPLVFDSKILFLLYFSILVLGTFLGFIGAYISVSKSLKQKVK